VAERESYPSIIDRDRQDGDPAAEPGRGDGRGEPPHARADYKRKRAIDRDLARYYEQCKSESRGRMPSARTKNYCAAVAWTRVKSSGRFPDYPNPRSERRDMKRRMPPRGKNGRFLKRGSTAARSTRRASESSRPRKRAPASRARETPREPSRPRSTGKRPRSGGGKRPRSTGRRPSQTNIAIVPVGAMPAREAARTTGRRPRARERTKAYEKVLMGAGGLTLFVTAAFAGNMIADVLDRYIAGYDPAVSPAPTLVAPYAVDNPIPKWNNDSQAMQPSIARMGFQALLALVTFGAGAIFKSSALKLFFYGLGTGATVHLGSQILTAYVIVPMVKGSTSTGARLYQHEINVLNGIANPSGGILGQGPGNRPRVGAPPVGTPAAPPQLPANQPRARMPVALATEPAHAAAAAAAPAAAPARVGAPPAHVAGCACQACAKPAPAARDAAPAAGAHPLWAALLDVRNAA